MSLNDELNSYNTCSFLLTYFDFVVCVGIKCMALMSCIKKAPKIFQIYRYDIFLTK